MGKCHDGSGLDQRPPERHSGSRSEKGPISRSFSQIGMSTDSIFYRQGQHFPQVFLPLLPAAFTTQIRAVRPLGRCDPRRLADLCCLRRWSGPKRIKLPAAARFDQHGVIHQQGLDAALRPDDPATGSVRVAGFGSRPDLQPAVILLHHGRQRQRRIILL